MSIMLPIILFVSWIAVHLAAVSERGVEVAKAGVPEDERGGVSFFPGIPLCPILFWLISYVIDFFFYPWGSISFMSIHIIVLILAVYFIIRNTFMLKHI